MAAIEGPNASKAPRLGNPFFNRTDAVQSLEVRHPIVELNLHPHGSQRLDECGSSGRIRPGRPGSRVASDVGVQRSQIEPLHVVE